MYKTRYMDSGVYLKNPLQPHHKPIYELGAILKDRDYEEYSIIVEIFCDSGGNIKYLHRDLSDLSRILITYESKLSQWYVEM